MHFWVGSSFWLLWIVSAAMDTLAHVFCWTYVYISIGYISRSGIAGPEDIHKFNFSRFYSTVFQFTVVPVYTHAGSVWELQLLHILANTWCNQFLILGHSDESVGLSQCGFILPFPTD